MKYWTLEKAFDAMSDRGKEALFECAVKGTLPPGEPELIEKIADYAYPHESELDDEERTTDD